jgi:NADH-quinone oxidoreductase subunit N
LNDVTLNDLAAILPALALIAGAFVVVAAGTLVRPERRQGISEFVCYFALAFALATVFYRISSMSKSADPVSMIPSFNGAVKLDDLALFVTLAVIAATGLAVVLSADAMKGQEAAHGEYYGLLLLSASGMMLLARGAGPDHVLHRARSAVARALRAHRGSTGADARSNEASIKYFVMGAFASGFVPTGWRCSTGRPGRSRSRRSAGPWGASRRRRRWWRRDSSC